LTHKGKLAIDFENNGIKVLSAFGNISASTLPRSLRFLRMLMSCIKLFSFLLRNKPDIVHLFLPTAYLLGGIVSLFAGQKILIMSRRSLNNYQSRNPLFVPVELRLHKYMTAILCNSRKIESQLLEENIPGEKIGIIYNGISVIEDITCEKKLQIRKKHGVDESALVLIMVANYIPYKGHADLIKALGYISDQIQNEWILLCIGRDDGIRGYLVAMTDNMGLSSNVRFLDGEADVMEMLAISDISLLCSHEEGFSNSILEAMALGLPVIATDVGGNSEAVLNSITGLIVPVSDPVQLGDAILKLANDKSARKEMGYQGKSRVAKLFSQDKCIDMYDKLYHGLMETSEKNIKTLINQPAIN
jgi:glycosyltransferase involved in cell wall biosynthesis